jgi:hypothetical protein
LHRNQGLSRSMEERRGKGKPKTSRFPLRTLALL